MKSNDINKRLFPNNQNALSKQDKYLEIMKEGTGNIIYSIDRLGRNVYQTSRVCEKVELKKSYIISVTEQTCFGINRLTDQLFFQKLIEAEINKRVDQINVEINL